MLRDSREACGLRLRAERVNMWYRVWGRSHDGHVVTARSCCLEMLLCSVVWIAVQASRMAVGGWSASL